MAKSNAVVSVRKPRPDFPLFPHGDKAQLHRLRWAKKVRGKLCYFGKVESDPQGQAALQLWLDQKDDLLAGRKPRGKAAEGVTLADVINGFLDHKNERVKTGELAHRTWQGYKEVGVMLADKLGRDRRADDLRADDFAELRVIMAKRWGPVALANRIQVVRCIFRWAYLQELLADEVRFGPGFAKPSAKVLREARQAKGPRMFTSAQIVSLLAASTPHMKAMVLLAMNGGVGNADVGNLPQSAIDLENGWLNYPRKKTAIHRRIPLWPETVEAVKLALSVRTRPLDRADDELCFIGPRGKNYRRGFRVSAEFLKAAVQVGVPGEFYSLRRTFQTIAEASGDFPAVSHVMGHAPQSGDMASVYRQTISDERLRAVVNHVRGWLWPASAATGNGAANSKPGAKKRRTKTAESQLRVVG